MNESLVLKLNNINIYLINDNNIPYYLSVPSNVTPKINIAVNLSDNINNDNLTTIYQQFDNNNICVITPIFNQNVLSQIKVFNEQYFIKVDKYISYLINNAYKILCNNNNIDGKIILVKNNNYLVFEEWFKSRYKNRVEYDKNDEANIISDVTMTIPTIETTSIVEPSQPTEQASEQPQIEQPPENGPTRTRELGFVSYVLLGVVVAVASLVLLYLLI